MKRFGGMGESIGTKTRGKITGREATGVVGIFFYLQQYQSRYKDTKPIYELLINISPHPPIIGSNHLILFKLKLKDFQASSKAFLFLCNSMMLFTVHVPSVH